MRSKLPLILIICLVLFRGWYGITHVNFTQDQARDVMFVRFLVSQHQTWVPYGPKTSVADFYLAPLYYQIMVWLYLITGQDLGMLWLTIGLESITPWLLYLVFRHYFSPKASLLGACVYALSYQVVGFGTAMWNPNLIPFLTALILYSTIKIKQSPRWMTVLLVAVAAAFNFHYQAAVLFPFAAGVSVWYLIRKQPVKYLVIGALGCLVIFLPYILTEQQYGWPNTAAVMTFLTKDHPHIYDRVTKPAFVLTFIPGFIERTLIGINSSRLFVGRLIWLAGSAAWLLAAWRQKKIPYPVLSLYLVTILVMLRVYKGDKLDYYLGTLYLLPAMLLTVLASFRTRVTTVLAVCLVLVAGYRLALNVSVNGYQATNELCRQLSKTKTAVRPIIHDSDLVHLLKYCSSLGTISFDHYSTVTLDVCSPTQDCGIDDRLYCTNQIANVSRLLKQTLGYRPLATISSPMGNFYYAAMPSALPRLSFTAPIDPLPEIPNNPIPAWLRNRYTHQDYLYE